MSKPVELFESNKRTLDHSNRGQLGKEVPPCVHDEIRDRLSDYVLMGD